MAQLVDSKVHINFFKEYIRFKPEVLALITDPPDELVAYALRTVPTCYAFLGARATPAAALIAVTANGNVLRQVTCQTPEIVMAAVRQTGMSLEWAAAVLRTYDVCLEALKQDRRAVVHVPPRTWQLMLDRLTL